VDINKYLKMLKRSIRPFARWQKPTNDFLTPEFIKKQKRTKTIIMYPENEYVKIIEKNCKLKE